MKSCEACGNNKCENGRNVCSSCRKKKKFSSKSFHDRNVEQSQNQRLRNELKELSDELIPLRALSRDVARLGARIHQTPVKIRPTTKVAGKRNGTFMAIASDWHLEETVDPGKVAGRNAYNLTIAKQRAQRFFESIVWSTKLFHETYHVDGLILAILGDIITGYLHDDNVESNALSPTNAIKFAYAIFRDGIEYLLANVQGPITIPVCDGNHGRLTEKTRANTRQENSIEQLLYFYLAEYFRNNKRVTFVREEGALTHLDVYGRTIRYMHGDTVKYGGGVGGITIPINKAISRLDTVRRADLTVMGHFHRLTYANRLIINGSLIGYSPYAISISAEFEPPQQAGILIDSEHFDSIKIPLWVASTKEQYK